MGRLVTLSLGCLLALSPSVGIAQAHSAGPLAEADPLLVHIDKISPVLPRRGNVKISGTVTNLSDDTFTRINLHAFASATPIIDATALAASAAVDPNEFVGERVTEPGTFDTVDILEPGDTATFSDSVPVDLFGILDQPGIYWIGIHAFGDGAVERDQVADGRARTFIPLLPRNDPPRRSRKQEAAVIIALRGRVSYDEDGRVGGADRWARWLQDEGRLGASLDIAESAGSTPYSWLVDPAILLALLRLSDGNPPRSLAADPSVPGQESTDEPKPVDSLTDGMQALLPRAPATAMKTTKGDRALAEAASSWLGRFLDMTLDSTVLSLPYGDLDVSAAARHSPQRYAEASARSAKVMAEMGLVAQPALAPESGAVSPEALEMADSDAVIVLSDSAFASPPKTAHSVVRVLGHKIVVTSTGAESGGPGPTPSEDPLALRQRLLSEAAIRLIARDTAPIVVTVPNPWPPGGAASFFAGLDQPWLDVVSVTDLAERSAAGVSADALTYSDTDEKAEIDVRIFEAADRAAERAVLLEDVLTRQTMVESQTLDEVLVTLSQQLRRRPRLALRMTDLVTDSLQSELDKVRVEGVAVTLSGESGEFGATVINGLREPVTVRLEATTDADLTLGGPVERRLGPGSRSVVRFEASTKQRGIHTVRLAVTTVDGTPTGSVAEVPLRAAQVSALIWIILAGSALVLLGALGFRLPRQIRVRRAEQAASAAAAAAESSSDADSDDKATRAATDAKQENA